MLADQACTNAPSNQCPGLSACPNCQATQAGLSHASFTNSMGAFVPLGSPL